jgi:hypothetical protein
MVFKSITQAFCGLTSELQPDAAQWDAEQDFMTWEAFATQRRRLEGMSS